MSEHNPSFSFSSSFSFSASKPRKPHPADAHTGRRSVHRQGVLTAKTTLPNASATFHGGQSSPQNEFLKPESLPAAHNHTKTILNNEECIGQHCGSRRADQAASCAVDKYPYLEMMESRGQNDNGRLVLENAMHPRKLSYVVDRPQLVHSRSGRIDKLTYRTDMDKIRRIDRFPSQVHAAEHSYTWSIPRYPFITCGNGNGDVKPDHPSGPGTYGHVV